MQRKSFKSIGALLACLAVGGATAGTAGAAVFASEEEPNDTASQADFVSPALWRYGAVSDYSDFDVFFRRASTRVTVTNTSGYGSGAIRVYFPDTGRTYFVDPGHSASVWGGSSRYWHFIRIDALDDGYHTYRLTAAHM